MGNASTNIHNSTGETVKICLLDTKNNKTDAVILAGETWSKDTETGWNTVVIIPLNSNQNTFSYTLESTWSLIIKRKLGKLILIPLNKDPKSEMDVTISGGIFTVATLRPSGCIVYNDSKEPIRICVTDVNDRNTNIILDHGEHNIVKTPIITSLMGSTFPPITVSVLDFNPNNEQEDLARAKYSIDSLVSIQWRQQPAKFLRVIKKDGSFTIEEDVLYFSWIFSSNDIPLSYLFSKNCCQKVNSIIRSFDARNMKGMYRIVRKNGDEYDVIPEQEACCVM
jgi:hypothetical protein